MRLTIDEFTDRIARLVNARGTVLERATGATAGRIKRELVASARSRVRRTPHARPSWIRYTVTATGDGAYAVITPRGGMPILAEKGSYLKPSGYTIPRGGKPRKGRGWRGPFHHPAIPAQPWWQAGVDRAAPVIPTIYMDAIEREIRKHF